MKDRVERSHLTKFDAFRVDRDQVMDLETWFKIHTNVSNVETAFPKPYKLLNFFMISVILLKKWANIRDLHLSFSQMVGE